MDARAEGAGSAAARASTRPPRPLDVERLAAWAWREELPRLERAGGILDGVSGLWDYGTRIDTPTLYACAFDGGPPEEDALTIAEALNEVAVAHPAPGWHRSGDLLAGLPAEVAAEEERALAGYRCRLAPLVILFARSLGRPDWRVPADELPERRPLRGANGVPLWFVRREIKERISPKTVLRRIVEARAPPPRRGVRVAGAYQKFAFEPPVSTIADRRADYANWHGALTALKERLAGRLLRFVATGPQAAARPWIADTERRPVVWSQAEG